MRHLDLFSGYGGFTLGLADAGVETIAFSEIDPFASAVLEARFPGIPNLGDVSKIKGADVHAELVTAGFPCQGASVAGLRGGLSDDRTALFWQIIRIVEEMEVAQHGPRFILLENVPGLLSLNGGRDHADVLGACVGATVAVPAEGWRSSGVVVGASGVASYRILDAQHFGVPQRRARWICLVERHPRDARSLEVLLEPQRLPRNPEAGEAAGEDATAGAAARARGGEPVTHALNARRAGSATEDGTGRGVPLVPDELAPTLRGGGAGGTSHGKRNGSDQMVVADVARPLYSQTEGGGARTTDSDSAENLVVVSPPVTSKWAKGNGGPAGDETQNLVVGWDGDEDHAHPGSAVVGYDMQNDAFDAPIPIDLRQTSRGGKLTNNRAHGSGGAPGSGVGNANDPAFTVSERGQAVAFKASHYTRDKDGAPSELAPPLSADADKGDQDTLVLGTFQQSSMTGRGTVGWEDGGQVVRPVKPQGDHQFVAVAGPIPFDSTQITHPENRSNPQPGDPAGSLSESAHAPTIAFGETGDLFECFECCLKWAASSWPASCPQCGADDAFEDLQISPRVMGGPPERYCALVHDPRESIRPLVNEDGRVVAFEPIEDLEGFAELADPVAANQARTYTREGKGNFRVSNVAHHAQGVRRLTPVECERLQGLPDGWTDVPYRGKKAADGPRYRAIGNGVAVPCVRWVGARLRALVTP